MRDPAERIIQRLEKELAQVEQAGVKPLELSAQFLELHTVVGSTLRHIDLECLNLQAEMNVLANAALSVSTEPGVVAVKIRSEGSVVSDVKARTRSYFLNRNLRRLRTLKSVVSSHVPHADLTPVHKVSLSLSEIMKSQSSWCRSCAAPVVESSFFRAMSVPTRLVELRAARKALEASATCPTPALVTDCYHAISRMKSCSLEPSLVGRAREVEREINLATTLMQQTSYSVLEDLERRAVYEYLANTSAVFLASSTPSSESANSIPLQTLATLWASFCKAGVEGKSPRQAFLEAADAFSVKRYAETLATEHILESWELAVLELTNSSTTEWFIVSREDSPVYSSSSIVRAFVAITSGRADVMVTAVGPHTASILQVDKTVTVLGQTTQSCAQEVASMTQALIQNGGILEDPAEAFKAASALSVQTV